jgi:hypothetical protein
MQLKRHSVLEALLNTFSGMLIAFTISQVACMLSPHIPGFKWDISVGSNIIMTTILTVVSILRSYFWRRTFNKISENYNEANNV